MVILPSVGCCRERKCEVWLDGPMYHVLMYRHTRANTCASLTHMSVCTCVYLLADVDMGTGAEDSDEEEEDLAQVMKVSLEDDVTSPAAAIPADKEADDASEPEEADQPVKAVAPAAHTDPEGSFRMASASLHPLALILARRTCCVPKHTNVRAASSE